MPQWLRTVLGTAGGLTIVAILVGGFLLYQNADTDSTQSTDIHGIVAQQRRNAIRTCERGNDSRSEQVKGYRLEISNFRHDISNLRSDRQLILTLTAGMSESVQRSLLLGFAEEKQERIAEKKETIAETREVLEGVIRSQAKYAIHKGSPRIDCEEANSLASLLAPLPSPISRRI